MLEVRVLLIIFYNAFHRKKLPVKPYKMGIR